MRKKKRYFYKGYFAQNKGLRETLVKVKKGQMSIPAISLGVGVGIRAGVANVLSCYISWEGKCPGRLLSVHKI